MSIYQKPELKLELLEDWDPLFNKEDREDPDLLIAARKREIRNILKSYTGYYDLFSELLQNALDAVERRVNEDGSKFYTPKIWVRINLQNSTVSVTDNGCGMTLKQFQGCLRPNFSFKDGSSTRGNKGVGATYLAYGFNHLEIATKTDGKVYSGLLQNGRVWLEDKTGTIGRPVVTANAFSHEPFKNIDRGTSVVLQLIGANIRPKSLGYVGATTAKQWMKVLQIMTPVGGIYLCNENAPRVQIYLEVVHPKTGETTTELLEAPHYVFPHEVLGKTADLREYFQDQKRRSKNGGDLSKTPPKFTKINGLWGEWTGEDILNNSSPLSNRLNGEEEALVRELGVKLYAFLGFSTDLWDQFNDKELSLRDGYRILRGGLQLATRNMPQGNSITIPLTNNIGFQNVAHIIVHFDNAEPDLGRKGFQPEIVRIAEKLSVSAVTAFRKYTHLLRKKTGAPALEKQMKLDQWIRTQEEHEQTYPLVITGAGLFMPTEELPIRSRPVVEQDVVALFNQMLSSGIIRGIQILSSSQYNQYDGLFRICAEAPFGKYVRNASNPLGVNSDIFGKEQTKLASRVQVLEYKFNVDDLIQEFQTEEKNPEDIGLVVAWRMGTKWSATFDVTSYLDDDNTHLRQFHGATHGFAHSASGNHSFDAIILEDLVNYLVKPEEEVQNQRKKYSEDWDR